jgi:hypothetical protein
MDATFNHRRVYLRDNVYQPLRRHVFKRNGRPPDGQVAFWFTPSLRQRLDRKPQSVETAATTSGLEERVKP